MSTEQTKDVDIKINDPSVPGGFKSIDLNDQNVGKARAPLTLPSDPDDQLVTKSYSDIHKAAAFGFASQSGGNYYSPFYTANQAYPIFGANYLDEPTGAGNASTAVIGYAPYTGSKTVLKMSLTDAQKYTVGDLIHVNADVSAAFFVSGFIGKVEEVLTTGTDIGVVIDIDYNLNGGNLNPSVARKLASFVFDSAVTSANFTTQMLLLGHSDLGAGLDYLGVSENFTSTTQGDSLTSTNFIRSGGIQAKKSRLVRIFGSTVAGYDGVWRYVSSASDGNADGKNIQVAYRGDATGNYEYVLYTPVLTYTGATSIRCSIEVGVNFRGGELGAAESFDSVLYIAQSKDNNPFELINSPKAFTKCFQNQSFNTNVPRILTLDQNDRIFAAVLSSNSQVSTGTTAKTQVADPYIKVYGVS